MESNEARAYHALASSGAYGYKERESLAARYGSWISAYADAKERSPELPGLDKAWSALKRTGIRIVLRNEAEFPALLREIPHPPHAIYYKGTLAPDAAPAVAIVGTRKATDAGKVEARRFAGTFAEYGVAVISGLALGVDGAAHEGALDAKGKTVAVLAHGLDRVYPASHARLAHRILENGGALISEYSPGHPPLPHQFLERNRIISGLSRGVLLIEAPEGSGSLATARFAVDQNRAVFALPGPARHQNFSGSHRLIREGAELVTEPEHILESLGIAVPSTANDKTDNVKIQTLGEEERMVFGAIRMASAPLSIDKIAELTHLEVRTVSRTTSTLAIRGMIQEADTGYIIGRRAAKHAA